MGNNRGESRKCIGFLIGLAVTLVWSNLALAAEPGPRAADVKSARSFVYHGKLVRPDGSVPQGSLSVKLKILSPEPTLCVLWSETQTVKVDNGAFSLELGHSVHRLPGAAGGAAADFKQAFINNAGLTIAGAQCASGNSYTPTASDDRLLSATFNDRSEVVEIAGLPIKSVPFALQAEEIGGYGLSNLAKISGAGSNVTFAPLEIDELKAMADVSLPFDMKNRLLKNVAAPGTGTDAANKSYVDAAVAGAIVSAGAGTVSDVSVAGGGLSIANGSTTPQITLNAASGSSNGYLTSADWNTFNGKQPAGAYLTSISSGNVTTALGFTPLSNALPTNQVFLGVANVATAKYFGIADLRGVAGTAQFPSCASSQTLYWNSGTDTLACVSINNLDADKITGGTLATARLGSGTANGTTYLRGDQTWATIPAGADHLGNHVATQNLDLAAFKLVGNGGTNGISIDATGKVGVGTTSPSEALEVVGKVQATELCIGGDCRNIWPSGGGGGSVVSVSSINTDIGVANGATAPSLTLNSGVTGGAGDANRIAKLDSGGLLATGMIPNLAAGKIASGQIAIAQGGTNSGAVLNNNRVMISTGGAIVESAAITANRALTSSAGGLPVASSVTDTELGFLSGVTSSVQTQISGKQPSLGYTPVNKAGDVMTGPLDLASNGLAVGTNQLVVSGGNVGIGTASPAEKLEVVGGKIKSPEFCIGASCITVWPSGGGGVTSVSSANTDIGVTNGSTTPLLTLNSGTTGGAGDANSVAKLDSAGLLTPAMIPNHSAAKITSGTLAIAQGGTNSGAVLNNNRVMVSSGSAIVESAAITANRALASSANGIPVATGVTDTELGYLSGVTSSVQTQLGSKQASNAELSGIAAIALTGIVQRTAAGTYTALGTTAPITVTGGNLALTYSPVNKAGDTMTGTLNLANNGLAVGTNQLAVSGGSVGIGTASPVAKLDVLGGQVRVASSTGAANNNTSATVNWNNGNAQSMSVACTSASMTNMLDGGTYILAVSETGSTQCTFTHAGLTFYYYPANGARTSGQRTVYTFQRIGSEVYVSWIAGFQ